MCIFPQICNIILPHLNYFLSSHCNRACFSFHLVVSFHQAILTFIPLITMLSIISSFYFMLAFSSDNLLTKLSEYYSYVMHVMAIMPLFFLLLCVCNVVDDTWCVTCTGALTSPKFPTSMIHASKLFLF